MRPAPEPQDAGIESRPLLDESLRLLAAESLVAKFNYWLVEQKAETASEQPAVLAEDTDITNKVDAGTARDIRRTGNAGAMAIGSSLAFAASMMWSLVSWKTGSDQITNTEKIADGATFVATAASTGRWALLKNLPGKFKTQMEKTADHLIAQQSQRVLVFLLSQPYKFPVPDAEHWDSILEAIDWASVPPAELKRGRSAAIEWRDRMAGELSAGNHEARSDFDPHIFAFSTAWQTSEAALGLQRGGMGLAG